MKKTLQFIHNLYNNAGAYKFSPTSSTSDLYSTCFAVMALDLVGELQNLPYSEKIKITDYILSKQNQDGFFTDTTIEHDSSLTHKKDYLQHQLTDFAIMALSSLNKGIRCQLAFLEKYKNQQFLEDWLNGLDWNDPWMVSNQIMFVLNFLIYERENNLSDNTRYINKIIEWLTKRQNPQTGFWDLNYPSSLHNQMAGAYHFLFFYTYLEKEPENISSLIDTTLMLQDYDGLFNYSGGGGSCDDLDAIDILCRSTFYTNYRRTEISHRLKKAHTAIKSNQNSDGGFCWAKRDYFSLQKLTHIIRPKLLAISHKDFLINAKAKLENQLGVISGKQMTWKYSGLKSMEIRLSDSDIWSTWFRLLALALIEMTFPKLYPQKTINWNMKRTCGLGFYKKE